MKQNRPDGTTDGDDAGTITAMDRRSKSRSVTRKSAVDTDTVVDCEQNVKWKAASGVFWILAVSETITV